MEDLAIRWRARFSDREYLVRLAQGIALFAASLLVNFYAGTYATERASNAVTDIVLSNVPVFDVDVLFVYGPVILWCFVVFLCAREPKRFPYVFKSVALFIFIRSIFITLTHIGPFPTRISITSSFLEDFTFGADLFFSGHTGLPFLLALIFWDSAPLRRIFLASSIFFGIVVLLGHLHYSIDVLSAFFITFTIDHLAQKFFKKDYGLFHA